ncbi:MAG: Co2+/Mg2+ efflux protein ApaG [Bacteroidota bacterium]
MTSAQSSMITDGIRVNVRTTYMQDESAPKHHYYVFAYQVEIINESMHQVQLLSRVWHIVDGLGEKRMVQGEGVIGKQPVINPGERHTYVSGCHFTTPIGKMWGTYTMRRQLDGARLKVRIPAFVMQVPYLGN